jgi:hypothetical protein
VLETARRCIDQSDHNHISKIASRLIEATNFNVSVTQSQRDTPRMRLQSLRFRQRDSGGADLV